jgi:hypothetical protein
MIKTLTAYTGEIDDVESAVSGILGQLDMEKSLLKNSVGLFPAMRSILVPACLPHSRKSCLFPLWGQPPPPAPRRA